MEQKVLWVIEREYDDVWEALSGEVYYDRLEARAVIPYLRRESPTLKFRVAKYIREER